MRGVRAGQKRVQAGGRGRCMAQSTRRRGALMVSRVARDTAAVRREIGARVRSWKARYAESRTENANRHVRMQWTASASQSKEGKKVKE